MTVTIGRRELLAALGGAASWPLAARAQQARKLPTVGLLHAFIPRPMVRLIGTATARTRLGRGSQRRDRVPLGRGT
jgi:hypothetical protein